MLPSNDHSTTRLSHRGKVIQPLNPAIRPDPTPHQSASQQAATPPADANPAIDLIRKKLEELYAVEPNAKEEKQEVEQVAHRSVHQQHMYDLSHSGRSLAEIQTAWHAYYAGLNDEQKHQVWQEFYANHSHATPDKAHHHPARKEHDPQPTHSPNLLNTPTATVATLSTPKSRQDTKPQKVTKSKLTHNSDSRTAAAIKEQLIGKVAERSRATRKNPHVQSLLFGISAGLVATVVLLFGFFNERFIAPFMTPSRAVSSTPIIIDPTSSAVGPEPKIIIPKINVEIPVVYDEPSIREDRIQAALERGVVHYATTPNPGEKGNAVIFGHSANNILNSGKYKFAFVLLKQLELNDTFYVNYQGKRYVYKVFDKKIVPPTDISVLKPVADKPATATLITCDPPGTNTNRLIIVAEQISPDPATNTASTVPDQTSSANDSNDLPGNSPTLWSRIRSFFN